MGWSFLGGHSPASIKMPDDRITQELHEQKRSNARFGRYIKLAKFVIMHIYSKHLLINE